MNTTPPLMRAVLDLEAARQLAESAGREPQTYAAAVGFAYVRHLITGPETHQP